MKTKREEAAALIRSFMAACASAVKCGESWSATMEQHHAGAKHALDVLVPSPPAQGTTTETKAPTAEDVEKTRLNVRWALGNGGGHASLKQDLDRVCDAALLGVQVPGLVRDLGHAQSRIEALASSAQTATRLEFQSRVQQEEVSALQARVAELTRERDAERLSRETLEAEREMWRTAEAERDALRLTVQRLTNREDEIREERDAALAQRDALRAQASALSAALGRAETQRQALHDWDAQGDGDGGVQDEAVDHFRALGDALRDGFAALSAPPAEPKPKPVEKRSCNLHADCAAESGPANECCTTSD